MAKVIAVLALFAVAEGRTLFNTFIWDDDYHVTRNDTLLDAHGLKRIWFEWGATPQYYPLTHSTFWLEHHAWADRPLGYHIDNLWLGAVNVVLVGALLSRLGVPGAWLAAALFAVHPIEVETVSWVSERKNLLSAAFYLLAFLAYLRSGAIDPVPQPHARRWYAASLGCFGAALLSKTITSTLPAAILVVVWWKRGRIRYRDIIPLLPMFVTGAVLGSLTGWMERNHVGAHGPEWAFSTTDRVLIAGRAVWFYAAKLLWPVRLQFIYHRWVIDPWNARQWLAPVGAVAVLIILWILRRRWGRGPLAAALLFGGTLAPALGFVNVFPMRYAFVADHFQYLAGIAVLAVVAAAITQLPAAVKWPVAGGVVLLLFVDSATYAPVFHDPRSVWTDVLQKEPDNWLANNNLGVLMLQEGAVAQAQEHFRRAVAAYRYAAESWVSLGYIAEQQKDYNLALRCYATAAARRPDLAIARLDLGNMLLLYHNDPAAREAARAELTAGLKLMPGNAAGHDSLGVALLQMGDSAGARREFKTALQLDPLLTTARKHLIALAAKGSG